MANYTQAELTDLLKHDHNVPAEIAAARERLEKNIDKVDLDTLIAVQKTPQDTVIGEVDFLKTKLDSSQKTIDALRSIKPKTYEDLTDKDKAAFDKKQEYDKIGKPFLKEKWKTSDFLKHIHWTDTNIMQTGETGHNGIFANTADIASTLAGIAPAIGGKAVDVFGDFLIKHGHKDAGEACKKLGSLISQGGEMGSIALHNTMLMINFLLQHPTDNVVDLFANVVKACVAAMEYEKGIGESKDKPIDQPAPPAPSPKVTGPNQNQPNLGQTLEATPQLGQMIEPAVKVEPDAKEGKKEAPEKSPAPNLGTMVEKSTAPEQPALSKPTPPNKPLPAIPDQKQSQDKSKSPDPIGESIKTGVVKETKTNLNTPPSPSTGGIGKGKETEIPTSKL